MSKINLNLNPLKVICGITAAICAGTSYFTYGKSALLTLLMASLNITDWFAEILLFVLFVIVFFIIYAIFNKLVAKYNVSNEMTLHFFIDDDSDGRRIREYQQLREGANSEILIMGIGMLYVSSDHQHIISLLEKGVNVKILILNPQCILNEAEAQNAQVQVFKMTDEHFGKYYDKVNYKSIIEQSIRNFQRLITNRKQLRAANASNANYRNIGTIELRTYDYFVPLNVTISDIGSDNSKLLIEFCIPFTNKRFRSKMTTGKAKTVVENQIRALWTSATLVSKDT